MAHETGPDSFLPSLETARQYGGQCVARVRLTRPAHPTAKRPVRTRNDPVRVRPSAKFYIFGTRIVLIMALPLRA